MSDFADDASEQQQLLDQIALDNQRRQAAQHQELLNKETGECLNCREALDKGRFCDADCREDFQKRARAQSMRR